MTTLRRPECFEFAMDFLGDPEEPEVRAYVEALEKAVEDAAAAERARCAATDLERFLALYRSVGIECIVNDLRNGSKEILMGGRSVPDEIHGSRVTKDERLDGYTFFYVRYEFGADGAFIGQGAFE